MSSKSGNWIARAIKHPGAFTATAKHMDMSTAMAAQMISEHPEKYSSKTVKRANLARTLAKMHR